MTYRINDTGELVSEQELRERFPGTLPAVFSSEVLEILNAQKVVEAVRPYLLPTQYAIEDGVEFIDGQWHAKWAILDRPAEEGAQQLAAAKAMAWDRIRSERDRRRTEGGVKVGDNWFLSTDRATSEYNSMILMSAAYPANTVLRANWRTMNGALVDMTPALVKTILGSGFTQLTLIDDAAQAHRAAMEASSDPMGYEFTTGWPEMFGDV